MTKKIRRYLILVAVLLCGLVVIWLALRRPVTLVVDDEEQTVITAALTAGGVVRAAGLPLSPADRLTPPAGQWLARDEIVYLDHASQVNLWLPGEKGLQSFWSTARLPAELMAEAGVSLEPEERIYWNGMQIAPDQPLPYAREYTLQLRPAQTISIVEDGEKHTLRSSSATLGQALWEAGWRISAADSLSAPPGLALEKPLSIVLHPARPIRIRVGEREVASRSAAATVGQALVETGLSLQDLDYSIPAEEAPLPEDGEIQLVRVREETVLEQTPIPFGSEFVEDPETEIDQQRVIEPGQFGRQVARWRVRYENGQEASRVKEAEWIASQPKARRVGYGTRIVIRTLETPDGVIEYWRAVPVYATSYSPCRIGIPDKCSYTTASGQTVRKGLIGVTSAWYRQMVGQQVYVSNYGYGQIADVGGGIPGKKWIDLAYLDDDYVAWYHNTTLYFLTPVPTNIPWILP